MRGFIELGFEVDAGEVAALEAALHEVDALAVTLFPASANERYAEPDEPAALWPRTRITGLFDHGSDVDVTLLTLAEWLPAGAERRDAGSMRSVVGGV